MVTMNDRFSGLYEIKGNATYCGPCVLSAISGKCSDRWTDGDMNMHKIKHELECMGMVAIERKLWLCDAPDRWLPDDGVMVLGLLDGDRRLPPGHVIAIGAVRDPSGKLHRWTADNHNHVPIPFEDLVTKPSYRNYVVQWCLEVKHT